MTDKFEIKQKLQELMGKAQVEVKKTAKIGMKMLSASKTNNEINKYYEDLGIYIYQAVKTGAVQLSQPEVHDFVTKIDERIAQLKNLEKDMASIKQSSKKNM